MTYVARFDRNGRPTVLYRASASLVEQLRGDRWEPCPAPVEDGDELVKLNADEAGLVAMILDAPGACIAA